MAEQWKWKLDGNDTVNKKDLKRWLEEMVRWGDRVRTDIRRLEAAGRMAAGPGDPGDPPPPPE